MEQAILQVIEHALTEDQMHPAWLTCKLMEETGEFAADILRAYDMQLAKTHTPDLYGEIADIMMLLVTIAAIIEEHRNGKSEVSAIDVRVKVKEAIERKFKRFADLLEERQIREAQIAVLREAEQRMVDEHNQQVMERTRERLSNNTN